MVVKKEGRAAEFQELWELSRWQLSHHWKTPAATPFVPGYIWVFLFWFDRGPRLTEHLTRLTPRFQLWASQTGRRRSVTSLLPAAVSLCDVTWLTSAAGWWHISAVRRYSDRKPGLCSLSEFTDNSLDHSLVEMSWTQQRSHGIRHFSPHYKVFLSFRYLLLVKSLTSRLISIEMFPCVWLDVWTGCCSIDAVLSC